MPYKDLTNKQVLIRVTDGYRLPIPENWPEEIGEIMSMCWLEESSDRPNFANLAIHFDSMLKGGPRKSSRPRPSGKLEFANHNYLDFLKGNFFNSFSSSQIPHHNASSRREVITDRELFNYDDNSAQDVEIDEAPLVTFSDRNRLLLGFSYDDSHDDTVQSARTFRWIDIDEAEPDSLILKLLTIQEARSSPLNLKLDNNSSSYDV